MMRRHAPTFMTSTYVAGLVFSFALVGPAAHAGTFEFIDNLFTFREDQKERVAPRRTLPPVIVNVPSYDERDASGWSNYYSREDLVARDYTPGSASKVMRPAPESPDSEETYWRMMQERMAEEARRQQAAVAANRIYVGEPGTAPAPTSGAYDRSIGSGTPIGNPVGDWRSTERNDALAPRPGDFDYVAPTAMDDDRWQSEDLQGGRIVTATPRVLPAAQQPARPAENNANKGGYDAPAEYANDSRYVDFNEQGQVVKYRVQKGDTLSGIAGQPAIYENWKLWPLIYSANRGAIGKSPANLKVEQKLGIPRGYTEQQAKEAEARSGRR